LLAAGEVAKNRPVLLVLDPLSAERLWFESDGDSLPAGSPIVCAADIRGVGALTPEYSAGAAEYEASHRREEDYAWGSLILGKPLVGQRVVDILALVAALRKHPATAGRPVRIAAAGKLTVPALFAAALDTGIERIYLSGGLVSFRDIVDTELYEHSFANFIPGFLNHTDLPDVAASIAPRRIVLAGSVNAKGETMPAPMATQIYEAAHRGGHLSVEPDEGWSVERLVAFATEPS